MSYYTFSQNNSGGGFDVDTKAGIAEYVIIEATDIHAARDKAESIGLYFNGVEDGQDCDCCGDRWYMPWSDESDAAPSIYGKPIAADNLPDHAWTSPQVFVHHLDGRVQSFG